MTSGGVSNAEDDLGSLATVTCGRAGWVGVKSVMPMNGGLGSSGSVAAAVAASAASLLRFYVRWGWNSIQR